LTLGSPFFPLIQSGSEKRGTYLVKQVTQSELRLAEELVVGTGGDQFAEMGCFTLRNFQKQLTVPARFKLLFGVSNWSRP